jgi:Domain of unknown function (DUF4372)
LNVSTLILLTFRLESLKIAAFTLAVSTESSTYSPVPSFVAMLFCQLGRAQAPREICGGLRSSEGKRTHLGIAAPARSTLDLDGYLVMDRGYVDCAWFGQLTAQVVFFVTRLTAHAGYTVVERRRVPERSAVLQDEIIEFPGGDAFAWSLSNLAALLRMHLFTHRDLWAWLDKPFHGPPTVLIATQAELGLG